MITEAENMRFSVDITEPDARTLSVDLSAKIVSSGKKVSAAYIFDKEDYEIRISINGKDYPVLNIHTDNKGRTFTYGEYYYDHVHKFSDWSVSSLPDETTPGIESRGCYECYFEEERDVAPTNIRGISVDNDALRKVYDGKAASISIDSISFEGKGTVNPVIEFRESSADESAYSADGPVDAGMYYVRVTVPADGEYKYESSCEFYYDIVPRSIDFSSSRELFSPKKYNGEKQRWEVFLSGDNSGSDYYIDGMPDGERIRISIETESEDAGSYLFNYNNSRNPYSYGELAIDYLDGALESNYSITIINKEAVIEKAKLDGTLTAEKEYDGFSSFSVSNTEGISGITEADNDGLRFEISRRTQYCNDPDEVVAVKIYCNDTEITKNYSFNKDQFSVRLNPRKLTFAEFGDVLYTPSIKYNIEIVKNRVIRFCSRNNAVPKEIVELRIYKPESDWKADDEILLSGISGWLGSNNYMIDAIDAPKTIKVVSVDDDISSLIAPFGIPAGDYKYCSFRLAANDNAVIRIEGNDNDKVQVYICDSSGNHYYVDDAREIEINKGEGSLELGPAAGTFYLFIYSMVGADGLTVTRASSV